MTNYQLSNPIFIPGEGFNGAAFVWHNLYPNTGGMAESHLIAMVSPSQNLKLLTIHSQHLSPEKKQQFAESLQKLDKGDKHFADGLSPLQAKWLAENLLPTIKTLIATLPTDEDLKPKVGLRTLRRRKDAKIQS